MKFDAVMLLLTLCLCHAAGAQTLRLVRDLNTSPISTLSNPKSFKQVGDVTFFTAETPEHGRELWKTDGTEAGTVMVKDIDPGSRGSDASIEQGAILKGVLYFTAQNSDFGRELWRSDGTEAGTYLVRDITAGAASSEFSAASQLVRAGALVFFVIQRYSNAAVWCSDGTSQGTRLVRFIDQSDRVVLPNAQSFPSELVALGSSVFFAGTDQGSGQELWKSDGTPEGTLMVHDIRPGSADSTPRLLTVLGDFIYFSAQDGTNVGQNLWRTDGTTQGTVMVKEIHSDPTSQSPIHRMRASANQLFFIATTASNRQGLWRSDGTEAGTYLIVDQLPGGSNLLFERSHLTAFGDSMLFWSSNAGWITSGQPGTPTKLVENSNGGWGPGVVVDGVAYLWGVDAIHRTDGTPSGTTLLFAPQGFTHFALTAAGSKILVGRSLGFYPRDGELWASSGSPGMIEQLTRAPSKTGSSDLDGLTENAGKLIFFTKAGQELWVSDGTEGGTSILREFSIPAPNSVVPNSSIISNPFQRRSLDGVVYFVQVNSLNQSQLWRSDGTPTGTWVLDAAADGEVLGVFGKLGDTLVFLKHTAAHGAELWISEGVQGDAKLLKDINPGASESQALSVEPVELGGFWYFFAVSAANGRELWRTDGTPEGTTLFADLMPGSPDGIESPVLLCRVGSRIYFSARSTDSQTGLSTGTELWRTDGTLEGTVLVKEMAPGTASSLHAGTSFMVSPNGILWFTAHTSTSGTELWRSDGTETGTFLVKDIYPGSASSDPVMGAVVNSRLFFSAIDASSGREPWVSDGTAAGTYRIADIEPGNGGSIVSGIPPSLIGANWIAWGECVYLSAYTGTSLKLWRTDGSTQGTWSIKGADPYWNYAPWDLTLVQGKLMFSASDPRYGTELHSLNLPHADSNPEMYAEALIYAGLSGPAAAPEAQPFGDGVQNLLKYAFNMNLSAPDARTLIPGTGTAGLPSFGIETRGSQRFFRIEFLRRRGVALSYTPEVGPSLNSLQPMSGTETVTALNAFWERVVIEQPFDPATQPARFARVRVSAF